MSGEQKTDAVEEFNNRFKIQLLEEYDLNSIQLITEKFKPLYVTQSKIHRNWKIGDVFLLSFSADQRWFHYILRVTSEYSGRGLALLIPDSLNLIDVDWRIMYRDNFKIPMLQKKLPYKEYVSNIFEKRDIPQDSYFAAGGDNVLFDIGFFSGETTPLWYLLNHHNTDSANMFLTGTDFKPKSNDILFNVRGKLESQQIPLYIYYSDDFQRNLDKGDDINDGMIDIIGKTNKYDLRFL